MPATIRVLIVDDSALIRQMLTRALSMDPRIEVVGTAKDGVEAIEKAKTLTPDVITLDIEMPELTGIEALPHLRKHSTARIVMLSSLDDPETTYKALSLGAVDFMPKPSAGVASSLNELTETLLKKIKTAYRISHEQAQRAQQAVAEEARSELETPGPVRTRRAEEPPLACVAIAASTGGPPALERVLSGLSASMPAGFVIVQHLPAGFVESLARRLDAVGDIEVSVPADGDMLTAGKAFIAPHGKHMYIERLATAVRVRFSDAPPLHGVRPAADVLMSSVAKVFGKNGVGVVLTGMGADGAEGAGEIKQAGGDVVAQDEATSTVWGMPAAVVRKGLVTRTVAIAHVAAEIRRAVRAKAGEA